MKSVSEFIEPLTERFTKKTLNTLESKFITTHRKIKTDKELRLMVINLSELISINTQLLISIMRGKQ